MILILTSVDGGTNFTTSNNVTSTLSGVSSTNWYISDDCLKVITDSNVYTAATISDSLSSAGTASGWLTWDNSFNYVLTATGILKYSTASNSYTNLHTFANNSFSSGAVLTVYTSNIVVY